MKQRKTAAPAPGPTKPAAPAKKPPAPAAPSAAKVKTLRAKAAASATTAASAKRSQATDCGGPLPLDTVHVCASIAVNGSDTYTVTTSAADDLLTIQLTETDDAEVTGQLTGPDGAEVNCSITGWYGPASCPTGAAGAYTLVITDSYGSGGYTLAVSSLRTSPCTALTENELAFGAAPLTGSIAAGGASACYAPATGAATSGDLLRIGGLSYELQATVYDASGTSVCTVGPYGDTCTLSGTGPYRVVLRDTYAQAVSYDVTLNRLSHPAGCAALPAAPFGDPGEAVASGSLRVGEVACRTVTLPDGAAAVSLQGGESTSGTTSWTLYTADGQQVCAGNDDATCDTLPGAGAYTLLLENTSVFDPAAYAVAVLPLTSTTGCAATVGTAYDLPLLHGTLASPVQTDCRPFSGTAGDRVDLAASGVRATIVDPSGTPSCSRDTGDGSSQDGCVLTGAGPYRVITAGTYDFTGAYVLRIARLSQPAGCTPLPPQAYGTDPAISADPCWLLQVPAAGTYDVGGTGVYHQDGTRFCAQGADSCTFPAAGTYAMVFRPDYLDDTPFAPVFVSPTQTAGCVPGSDTGFTSGPLSFDLTAPGRRDCLTLPTAAGNGLYLAASPSDTGTNPVETVYDARGVQSCENQYSFSVCKLTGTAPFHLVLTAPQPGVYGLTVQRTGDATGCAAWPRTSFGGSTGTRVQLTTAIQTVCLALPANGHSTAEMIDWTNTANRVNASVQVFDAAGNQVCATIGSSTTTCRYTAGVSYTAVLVGAAGADTYHLVRRDVSSTAVCAAPPSLTVGGPSTGYTFTSALDSRCLRVQAATTDKLWLSVRTPAAAADSGAELLVVDAGGAIVCWQHGASCRVSGSSSYVVAVLASGYAGTPIAAHVDTWRMGTAAGWVPQCAANSLSPDGFALRGGTLTESATAFCGVMQVKPLQGFDVYGTDSDPAATPALGLYSSANWNGTSIDYAYQCGGEYGAFDYHCSVDGNAAPAQVVFVLSPGAARTPVAYTMQGVCSFQCSTPPRTADLTSVAPASGPAETDNKVVIHGSNLTLGTEVELAQNGVRASYNRMTTPVSVSADGTTLTVLLTTRGVAPGAYDVVLDQAGYTTGTRSPGYLPGGYTVTAAKPYAKGGGPVHITDPARAVVHNRPS
ncbi:hypothetical protein [Streptomyces sp. NBC_01190]|uniref:hypothetical protein n=1 Tax=Streptomyces sp. NBC_01190 TaxID=2903767 RepID=UPI00386E46A6|nr:hypothetical protein OG519_15460 [Streptomyces sp. NBC_01190]